MNKRNRVPQRVNKTWRVLISGLGAVAFCLSVSGLDDDVDGMSDVWQEYYNIASGSDKTIDTDSDGYDNEAESTAATNPNSSGSKPVFTFEYIDWDVFGLQDWWIELHWYGIEAVRYQPQVFTNYFGAYGWYDIGSQHTGSTATIIYNDAYYDPYQDYDFTGARLIVTEPVDTDSDGFNDWEEWILGTDNSPTDTDTDGLPDNWENAYFPTLAGQDATDDSDSDGVANWLEFYRGMAPNIDDNQPGTNYYYVFNKAGEGSDSNNGLSARVTGGDGPKATLGSALSAAASTATIIMIPGDTDYDETNLNSSGKSISLKTTDNITIE